MAHFAFTCPPLPGHINPMTVLARELIARGHRVTFLGFPDMGPKLAPDLPFKAFGARDLPPGSLEPYLRLIQRLGGPVYYSYATAERIVGDLYPLYREPPRHSVTV